MNNLFKSARSVTYRLIPVEPPQNTKIITLSWRATFVAILLTMSTSANLAATAYGLGTGDYTLLKSYGQLGIELMQEVVNLIKSAQ